MNTTAIRKAVKSVSLPKKVYKTLLQINMTQQLRAGHNVSAQKTYAKIQSV